MASANQRVKRKTNRVDSETHRFIKKYGDPADYAVGEERWRTPEEQYQNRLDGKKVTTENAARAIGLWTIANARVKNRPLLVATGVDDFGLLEITVGDAWGWGDTISSEEMRATVWRIADLLKWFAPEIPAISYIDEWTKSWKTIVGIKYGRNKCWEEISDGIGSLQAAMTQWLKAIGDPCIAWAEIAGKPTAVVEEVTKSDKKRLKLLRRGDLVRLPIHDPAVWNEEKIAGLNRVKPLSFDALTQWANNVLPAAAPAPQAQPAPICPPVPQHVPQTPRDRLKRAEEEASQYENVFDRFRTLIWAWSIEAGDSLDAEDAIERIIAEGWDKDWDYGTVKKEKKIQRICEWIADRFDPARLAPPTEGENEADLNQKREWTQRLWPPEGVSREQLAVFLHIAEWALVVDPNNDDSMPRNRYEVVWKARHEAGLTKTRWNRHVWKRIRDFCEAQQILTPIDKTWERKRACKWTIGPNWQSPGNSVRSGQAACTIAAAAHAPNSETGKETEEEKTVLDLSETEGNSSETKNVVS